ncbi:MAG TPA: SPOR domain-containing protein, partial [Luteibaculaceae bacterium]|nr:SPOR domain-containing protein [Luteibaculaceae bacterium]
GFLTNAPEEDFLQSSEGKVYMASSIFRAFKTYKELTESIYGEAKTEEIAKPKESAKHAAKADEKPTRDSSLVSAHPESEAKSHESQAIERVDQKNSLEISTLHPLFKVQFLTSPKKLSASAKAHRGLKDVEVQRVSGTYKYTSGSFTSLDEAKQWQKEVRKKFPDAFVVAWYKNEFIPVAEALKLQSKLK